MSLMRVMVRLNEAQVARVSEVIGNLSLVFFASLVLPTFSGQQVETNIILSGLVLALGSFAISVQLLKGAI